MDLCNPGCRSDSRQERIRPRGWRAQSLYLRTITTHLIGWREISSGTAVGLWVALWGLTCVPGGGSDGVGGAGAGARGDGGDGAGRVAGLQQQTQMGQDQITLTDWISDSKQ